MTRPAILVVEDQPSMRTALLDFLGAAFPESVLHEARDAAQALELCGTLQPDVVLMDVQLPDGNGIELTAQITAQWPAVRVIVISYRNSATCIERALAAGALAFIPKESLDRLLVGAVASALSTSPRAACR